MQTISKVSLGLTMAVVILAGAGCYSSSNNNTSGTGNTVSMLGNAYSPANLTVAKGTTVTWTNNDNTTHTVTGDNGGPDSTLMSNGDTYQYTFDTVGTFPYHCTTHGTGMSGTVTVTE